MWPRLDGDSALTKIPDIPPAVNSPAANRVLSDGMHRANVIIVSPKSALIEHFNRRCARGAPSGPGGGAWQSGGEDLFEAHRLIRKLVGLKLMAIIHHAPAACQQRRRCADRVAAGASSSSGDGVSPSFEGGVRAMGTLCDVLVAGMREALRSNVQCTLLDLQGCCTEGPSAFDAGCQKYMYLIGLEIKSHYPELGPQQIQAFVDSLRITAPVAGCAR
jgi:hypothetical protein